MKIKRYLVADMREAMDLIRRDLGPEAVIINSRRVRQPGFRGWFSPERLEVTAALDEAKPAEEPRRQDALLQEVQEERRLWAKELAEVKGLLLKVAGEPENQSPEGLLKWKKLLTEIEVNNELIETLLEGMISPQENGDVPEQLLTRIAGVFTPGCPDGTCPRLFTFVGPTGVGKTTTIAKLAARFSIFDHKKVALVTVDTYRIGAVDQLRTYGEILGIPLEVVMTPKELRAAVDRHSDKEAILIDTAGRPASNRMAISELKGFLETISPMETFLVLSCNTKNRDLYRVVEDFKMLNYTQLIFTKADETDALGSVLNVAHVTKLPVAYITNGQNVPEDLASVDPQKLARMILGAVG